MPKRQRTEEERKAWGQKMKQAKEAKRAREKAQQIQDSPPAMEANQDIADLRKQVEELKSMLGTQPTPPPAQPQLTSRGIVGTITKFSVNPQDYPDPRERLANEPKLEQHAFKHNFELSWKVGKINYDTKDGIHITEPRFELDLIRKVRDEETGESTNKRYTVCRAMFFEDPDAAIAVAHEQGYPVDETLEQTFLDEMRYIRIRDWLLEAFYPPRPNQQKMNKTETVIGNRLVEVYEINSVESATIPFGNLKTKL